MAKDENDEFGPEEIHRMAMLLINALGRDGALARARRQEQETGLETAVARAIRMQVERLCAPTLGKE